MEGASRHDPSYSKEETEHPKQRKRKLDKDGFVTPLTPEHRQSLTSQNWTLDNGSDHTSVMYHNTALDMTTEENSYGVAAHDAITEESIDQSGDHNPRMQGSPSTSIESVLNDLGKEYQLLHNQWSNNFKQSEEFELLCPSRLDQLIGEARQLEQTFNQQKDAIGNRLHGLTKILQM